MLNLHDLPEVGVWLPQLERYSKITSTSVDHCLATAIEDWLNGPAREAMEERLEDMRREIDEPVCKPVCDFH